VWEQHCHKKGSVTIVASKLKYLRYEFKKWGKGLSHIKFLIDICNVVPEFNFSNIVKYHSKNLLGNQIDYWKQRCTIRCVQLGRKNKKYFHARAIGRYRHNVISEIKNSDRITLVDHQQKESFCFSAVF
jgi:hypothetical protein